jgi:DNA-directed RNA polymerase specialized sigma24 family protein
MGRTLLHLVDRNGQDLAALTRDAVEAAYHWAVWDFPGVDQALVAGWAEEVGEAMAARAASIEVPRRYAFAALRGKILEWFRRHPGREVTVGIGSELEQWVGVDRNGQRIVERAVLFEQLRAKLSERDRQILMLLLQDITSPKDVAAALGVKYDAAAKAIQRVKERLAAIKAKAPKRDRAQGPPNLCQSAS